MSTLVALLLGFIAGILFACGLVGWIVYRESAPVDEENTNDN